MRILVIGAGMYVTGRGTGGLGTVLPSLAEISRHLPIESVTVAATSRSAEAGVLEAADRTNAKLGTELRVTFLPADEALRSCEADCAIVSVPDHLHREIATAVLERGTHCLLVKPFVPTAEDARFLVELAARKGVHAAVELHKRFDESNLVVRELLRERTLGRLSHATVEYSQRMTIPEVIFRGWSNRTNIFQYLAVHYVDLLHFLTGFRPVRAMAIGTRGILSSRGVDALDSVHALVEWEAESGRFLSQFCAGWIDAATSPAMSEQKYTVVGENGRIFCDQTNRGLQLTTERGGSEAVNPYFSRYLFDSAGRRMFAGYGTRSIETFLREVLAWPSPAPSPFGQSATFAEASVSTGVIDAVNRSLGDGSVWMDVPVAN